MIDNFSLQQFQDALPKHKITRVPLWESLGIRNGEYCFYLAIDAETGIFIRSSVDKTGYAAQTGKDSIRAWLVTRELLKPLGNKTSKYITRVPGWETRLTETLRVLYGWRKKAGNCPGCNMPRHILRVKKDGPNKGKMFASCPTCKEDFLWL